MINNKKQMFNNSKLSTMSKKNQNAVVEEQVATEQNAVVEETRVETVFDQLNKMKEKEEQLKKELAELSNPLKLKIEEIKKLQKQFEEEHAEEIAAIRAERIKKALENKVEKKVNKSEIIRKLILAGKTKDKIKEETGFDNKTVLDITWRIEKELGLR